MRPWSSIGKGWLALCVSREFKNEGRMESEMSIDQFCLVSIVDLVPVFCGEKGAELKNEALFSSVDLRSYPE